MILTHRKIYRRYLLSLTLPLMLAAFVFGGCYLILVRLGETVGPIDAAKSQAVQPQLYGSKLFYRAQAYKTELALERRSDLLIAGSSRVMEFIESPFTISATNAGGVMRNVDTAETFFAKLSAAGYAPKIILLGLDYWWFTTLPPDADDSTSPDTYVTVTARELLAPFSWVRKKKLSWANLRDLILRPSSLPPGIGFMAKIDKAGWTPFGNYDYGRELRVPSKDRHFSNWLKIIDGTKRRHFRLDSGFSQEKWDRMAKLIADLQARHIKVIVFVPPVAPPIVRWMETQPSPNLVSDFRAHVKTLPVPVYDFHDASQFDSLGCEYIDGLHGGGVTDLRLLREMSLATDAPLHEVVNQAVVSKLIASNAGHAALREFRVDPQQETDFLDLGCAK